MRNMKKAAALLLAAVTAVSMIVPVNAFSLPEKKGIAAEEEVLQIGSDLSTSLGCDCNCGCSNCTCGTTYTASGYITNSTNGKAISGATVAFRTGYNNKTGTIYKKTTTNSLGKYSVKLKKGKYTMAVSKTGFITTYTNYNCTANKTTVNVSTSQKMTSKTYRIVLTWGVTPYDVDAHLTGPYSSTSRFHTYYGNKNGYYNSKVVANLDIDDRVSYGPETITINFANGMNGTYKYYVHDYTNRYQTSSSVLGNSGARVIVYSGSTQVASYSIPKKAGNLWYVCYLKKSGSTIKLTKVNKMGYYSSSFPIA